MSDVQSQRGWVVALLLLTVLGGVIWWTLARRDAGAPAPVNAPSAVARGVIEGEVVVAGSGAPVASAEVVVQGPGGARAQTSDDQGRFRFEGLDDGVWRVRARVEGMRAVGDGVEVELGLTRHALGVEVALLHPASVEGRLVSDGQPVAGTVTLDYVVSGETTTPASTDTGGAFALEELAPGRVLVRAQAEGYTQARALEVELESGARRSLGAIEMAPGAVVTGRVVDETGRGIPQARVEITGEDGAAMGAARTDGAGRYRIAGVEGPWVTVAARAAGHAPGESWVELAGTGEHAAPTLTLTALEGLVVRVVDAAGVPIAGASVVVTAPGEVEPAAEGESDGGDLYLESLRAGPYIVQASHPLYGPSGEVVVSAGAVALVALGAPSGIEGVVRQPDGRAARGAVVALLRLDAEGMVERSEAVALDEGRFALAPLEPGRYVIEARAPGYQDVRSAPIEIAPGGRERVTLQLDRGARLAGQVIDGATGEPLAGATVVVDGSDPQTADALGRRVVTDAEGRFVIEGIDDDRQSLRVAAPGYVSRLVSGISLRSGEAAQIAIGLEPLPEGVANALDLVGVGVAVERSSDGLQITRAVTDGPAQGAGLDVGDVIVGIDGLPCSQMTVGDALERIRGEEGTTVRLTVRGQDGVTRAVSIDRARVVQQW